jgi:uncharacterized protein YkwD
MGMHAAPVQLAVAAASLALVPMARAETPPGCPDADLRPTESNLPRVEAAMVCLLNAERASEDRARLTRDRRLERSAARQTRDMTRRGYFAHERKGGPSLLERIRDAGYFQGARSGMYSENLGYGPPERASAAGMHRAFTLSPSHRHTLMYPRFRNVGIGSRIIGPNPAFYPDYPAVVFTIDFGRRYERHRAHCRRRAKASASAGDGTRGHALPPRRWCRRRSSK